MKEDKFLGVLPISDYNINVVSHAIVKDLREYVRLCKNELEVLEDNFDSSDANMAALNAYFLCAIQSVNVLNKIQSIRNGDAPYITYQSSLIENNLPPQK
jgi:hypothetical protein